MREDLSDRTKDGLRALALAVLTPFAAALAQWAVDALKERVRTARAPREGSEQKPSS